MKKGPSKIFSPLLPNFHFSFSLSFYFTPSLFLTLHPTLLPIIRSLSFSQPSHRPLLHSLLLSLLSPFSLFFLSPLSLLPQSPLSSFLPPFFLFFSEGFPAGVSCTNTKIGDLSFNSGHLQKAKAAAASDRWSVAYLCFFASAPLLLGQRNNWCGGLHNILAEE